MALFLVTYDLRHASEMDYQPLWDSLEASNAVRVQESVWVMRGNYTASGLRDHFGKLIHNKDRLLVVEFTNWAALNPMADINKL